MKKLALLVVMVMSCNQFSWAVGGASYGNQVVGSRILGMGQAFAGIANDPSAVYINPAGLTQLSQPAVSYGLSFEPVSSKYTAKNNNTGPIFGGSADGTSAKMKKNIPVVPYLAAVVPAFDKWAFGFGINSPYGLETHWDDNGPLRYAATDSKIAFVNFNPTVSYKVNDKISLAGGVVYGLAPTAQLKKRVNNNLLGFALSAGADSGPYEDGNQKLEGDGDGWGYNLALFVQPIEKHSFGLSYRSKIVEKIDGTVEITGLQGTAATAFVGSSYSANVETELIQPESLILGYGFRPGKWTFGIDGEWIGFGAIDNTTLKFSGSNATADGILNAPSTSVVNRDWHNTWNLGMGANYAFNDMWEGRFGYYHHASVVPNATWDPSLPDSYKDGYTVGGSMNFPGFSIDATYNYIMFGKRGVTNSTGNGTANGDYKTSANVFSINATHRFGSK